MSVVLIIPLIVVLAGAVAISARSTSAAAWAEQSTRVRAVARTTRVWRLAGLVCGLLAGGLVLQAGLLGRGLLLAAPVVALCVLVGVLIGELRVTPPTGPVRSATLEVRRLRDYLPRRLFVAVASAASLLAASLITTTAMGSPDDMGRAGRWLVHRCSATVTEGRGPWPGSFYTAPVAAVVSCGLILAAVVLARVVRRPRPDDAAPADDALRRRSAAAVTAAAGLLVAVPLAGISAVAAMALHGMGCAPGWWTPLAGGLGLLSPALLALAGWCVLVLAKPSAYDRAPTSAAGR